MGLEQGTHGLDCGVVRRYEPAAVGGPQRHESGQRVSPLARHHGAPGHEAQRRGLRGRGRRVVRVAQPEPLSRQRDPQALELGAQAHTAIASLRIGYGEAASEVLEEEDLPVRQESPTSRLDVVDARSPVRLAHELELAWPIQRVHGASRLRNSCRRCSRRALSFSIWRRLSRLTSAIHVTPSRVYPAALSALVTLKSIAPLSPRLWNERRTE